MVGMLAGLVGGRPGTPLFWGIFCTDAFGDGFYWKSRIVRGISAFFSRWVSGVIYNAAEARDYHRRIGFREPRSVVISNCVNPEVFRHDAQHRGDLRAELGIK